MSDQVWQFFNAYCVAFLLLIITVGTLFYFDTRRRQSYWQKLGVKYDPPRFFFGSIEVIATKHLAEKLQALCSRFPDERYIGVYHLTKPSLLIKDPELIKQITVKDFDHFVNHRRVVDVDVDPLWSKNLFSSRDDRWRSLRTTLSPSFTGSKMKIMFHLMEECARQFVDHFKALDQEIVELEMKDTISRYTNDVIATTAFGLKCNSLKNREDEFYLMGKNATNLNAAQMVKFFFFSISPALSRLFKVRIISSKVAKYFSKIIEDTVKTRQQKHIVRPDMIHLLLEAQKETQKAITLEDITSQAFVFFMAGFETVSIFLTFAFYELAVNPDIQNRLREEIQTLDQITYEGLQSLKYLDMVVSEVLRKWPPFAMTDRQVSKDYTIEPVKPSEQPIHLKKGTICSMPIFAIHHDSRLYPNPEQFDPERFSDENKHKINPFAYLPFGAGPRVCIGSRFALLEGKLMIAHVLRSFEVVTIGRTPSPVVLDKAQILLGVKGGMWLGFKKLLY